ncbi:TetR family transcriptional regulator [Streptomyces candidus]|uniref:AcrR family transcriptional regulator n=1 Tax=Streptomyces candidus TaxID=67283 RepID=A0A7X0HKL3_9ACTN|nr:TetR family transcriptional regulator [Streptomyces candidus]MBB6439235.1 AcrR family transcriptional regulator [Streptomyces candidus]GHH44941.1 transcriptional regulator [Streptomyces candidus]
MSHIAETAPGATGAVGVRQAQKLRTRQALMDAALRLLEHQSLSSLGLREVTRAAGIAPTAFYRHFKDTAELGVALVEESLGGLHGALRTGLSAPDPGDSEARIALTVGLIADLTRSAPAHVRFVARERHGGVQPVRRAIGDQLRLFAEEVADALGALPDSAGWPREDLLMLAGIYVDHMVMTASAFLAAGPDGEQSTAELARRQLRLVGLGRRHWLDG